MIPLYAAVAVLGAVCVLVGFFTREPKEQHRPGRHVAE